MFMVYIFIFIISKCYNHFNHDVIQKYKLLIEYVLQLFIRNVHMSIEQNLLDYMITRCINDSLYLQKISRVVYSQTDPYLKQPYERNNQQRETCSSDRTVKSFFIINYIKFLNIYTHQFKNAEHIKTLLVHIYVCIVYQKLFLSKLAII